MKAETVRAAARGQWPSILNELGIAVREDGRHSGCPVCGGKDRFRFDDKDGHGTWFCNQCDPHAGDGLGLVKNYKNLTFPETLDLVGDMVGCFSFTPPKIDCNTATPLTGVTLEAYAEFKKLPPKFLQGLDITEQKLHGRTVVRMSYMDDNRTEMAVRYRCALQKENDDRRMQWRKGDKVFPYGVWRLAEARKAGVIFVVEGESDCHTLWYLGIPAIGLPGASVWKDSWSHYFEGINGIYLCMEPDEGGLRFVKGFARSAFRDRLRVFRLPNHKDPSALWVSDPNRDAFKVEWLRAVKASITFLAFEGEERRRVSLDSWPGAQDLAECPNILARFEQDFETLAPGEVKNGKRLYLVLTSRLLKRPVSVKIEGPSSVGKSYTLDQALHFFPDSAYFSFSAMSDHALAYFEEPMSHRFLVLYEATALSSEMGAYFIRSLLSEGHIKYPTVEKTPQGLKTRVRILEGPTGLIVTTTAINLHPENETRLLSVTVNDTREQTSRVFQALAEERDPPDLKPWKALQHWLDGQEHRVTIPYAQNLAKLVPPVAVRLRRDFGVILSLIKSHAILHQLNRSRDDQGRIIATKDDYAAIYELVKDSVAEGVDATVRATVRATVNVVTELLCMGKEEVLISDLIRKLSLDRSSVSRRVKTAISLGFLKNNEDRKGRPMRLGLGEPLPEETPILPSPDALDLCSVACVSGGVKEKEDSGEEEVVRDAT